MDRVTESSSMPFWLSTVVLAHALAAHLAWAGGVERFPESRFGAPPARPEIGVGSGYAVRAVESIEARGEFEGEELSAESWYARENVGKRRSPAGLEITGKTGESTEPVRGKQADFAPVLTPPAVNPTSTVSAITRKGVQEVALIAGDLGFFPKTVFVSRDVPVRLFVTGASKNTLCIMMDSFEVRRQIRSQKIEEITFTPDTPGKFRFYCPVNGMEGTLIVKELASNQTENSGTEAAGE